MHKDWYPLWSLVWSRDDPYRYDDEAFLDLETGEILWMDTEEGFSQSSEERDRIASQVNSNPDRYEWIPPLAHGDHHDIFARFLKTLPERIPGSCNTASIGGFLRDLEAHFPDESREIKEGWFSFHGDCRQVVRGGWYSGALGGRG